MARPEETEPETEIEYQPEYTTVEENYHQEEKIEPVYQPTQSYYNENVQPEAYPPPQQQPPPQPQPPQANSQAYPPPQINSQAYPPPQTNSQAYPPPQPLQTNSQAYPPPQRAAPSYQPRPQSPQMNPAYGPAGHHHHQGVHYQQAAAPVQYPPGNSPMYADGSSGKNMNSYPPQRSPPPGQFQQRGPQVQVNQSVNYPQGGYVGYNEGGGSPYKQQVGQAQGIAVGNQENWSSELFDCMDDPSNALITAVLPCVTFGQIAEIVDNGVTPCATSGLLYGCIGFLIGLPCVMSCGYRTKLRSKYNLVETPAPDWITHFLCEWCALCQEYRELQHRGFDPTIGWQGNLSRFQQQQAPMAVPMNQNMMA